MAKAAFFDVDNTLLRGNISLMYATHYFLKGEVPLRSLGRITYYVLLHKMNRLRYQDFYHKSLEFLEGKDVRPLKKGMKEYFQKKIRGRLDKQALAFLEERRKEGCRIVLLTNAPHLFVDNLAEEVRADDVIASKFEMVDGRMTGRCMENCYGEMKLSMLETYVKKKRMDPKKCYFYTDSYSDVPALSHVGHPVAFKPDGRLKRYAEEKGWEIVEK